MQVMQSLRKSTNGAPRLRAQLLAAGVPLAGVMLVPRDALRTPGLSSALLQWLTPQISGSSPPLQRQRNVLYPSPGRI